MGLGRGWTELQGEKGKGSWELALPFLCILPFCRSDESISRCGVPITYPPISEPKSTFRPQNTFCPMYSSSNEKTNITSWSTKCGSCLLSEWVGLSCSNTLDLLTQIITLNSKEIRVYSGAKYESGNTDSCYPKYYTTLTVSWRFFFYGNRTKLYRKTLDVHWHIR